MREIVIKALALAAVALAAAVAAAQTYPAKPVRLIVPFPPGGATDTFSRATAAEIAKSLGQQVIVENRPGAGTTIAADIVARAAPDGYTLFFTDLSTHAITASIYRKLAYHPLRDFAPVALVNASPLLLVAHPSVGARTVRELVALAKRRPGELTCGNSGIGTVTHMTAERFRLRAGIELRPVSYKGGATPVVALLGGEIALVMATVPAAIEHVRRGRLLALGVAAGQRSPYLPDVPAIGETVKGVEGAVLAGVLAPAGTPAAVISRLNAEYARAVDSPKVKEIFAANAAEARKVSPEALRAALEADVQAWAEVVKATGVRLD
jgi:tripartite-type tricarboxylate transporter receptor subunit TctC